MPGSFQNNMEVAILDHVFGGPDYVRETTLYIGLSTTEILDDGSGITEPSGAAAYARVQVDNDGVTWSGATTGAGPGFITQTDNAIALEFNTATGSWGEVTHFFIANDLTGTAASNILAAGELTVPKTISDGDTASFAIGDLEIRLD